MLLGAINRLLAGGSSVQEKLVFTNCERFANVITTQPGFLPICGRHLDALKPEDFREIYTLLQGAIERRTKRSPLDPLPHQQEALDALIPA